jgi:hypothetical protein
MHKLLVICQAVKGDLVIDTKTEELTVAKMWKVSLD